MLDTSEIFLFKIEVKAFSDKTVTSPKVNDLIKKSTNLSKVCKHWINMINCTMTLSPKIIWSSSRVDFRETILLKTTWRILKLSWQTLDWLTLIRKEEHLFMQALNVWKKLTRNPTSFHLAGSCYSYCLKRLNLWNGYLSQSRIRPGSINFCYSVETWYFTGSESIWDNACQKWWPPIRPEILLKWTVRPHRMVMLTRRLFVAWKRSLSTWERQRNSHALSG